MADFPRLAQLNADSLPAPIWLALLEDDVKRDMVSARRVVLLSILRQEGFLSREGLIARTEAVLGRGCFGAAPAATFGRDMRSIKTILSAAGYSLKYSRQAGSEGYYIPERPALAPELAEQIRSAMAEVDPRQIEIGRRLSPAARLQQAGRLSDGLRRIALQRLAEKQGDLALAAAHREVMHRYHKLGG